MPFELRYALRYLLSKRGGLARLTTISAILGIAFGVGCLIVVQAIYSGFRNGIEEKLLAQTAHVTVTVTAEKPVAASPDLVVKALKRDSNVKSVAPVLFTSAVVSAKGGSSYGLIRVEFKEESGKNAKGVHIGKELSNRLQTVSGDTLAVLFETSGGEVIEGQLKIAGLVETGLYEYDSQLVRISEDEFSGLTNGEKIGPNAYIVSLNKPFELEETVENLKRLAGPSYQVTDWRSANRPLFAALGFERRIAFVVFAIMVALAALGVMATLALLVNERRMDVAVLKTCGIRSSVLFRMFFAEGILIGVIGVLIGVLLGIVGCAAANAFGLVSLPGEVYSISELELMPEINSTLMISVAALLLIIPAVLFPVSRISRIKPAEIFRSE